MFATSREAVLSSCKWKNTNSIDYVEATRYGNVSQAQKATKTFGISDKAQNTEATSENFRHGSLHGNEILEWVDRKGPHAAPDTQKAGKLLGQIRLLIYERTAYTPIDLPVSKDIFIAIEKAFHLHAATLPSFETDEGTYSRYLTFSDSKSTKLERICMLQLNAFGMLLTILQLLSSRLPRNEKSETTGYHYPMKWRQALPLPCSTVKEYLSGPAPTTSGRTYLLC